MALNFSPYPIFPAANPAADGCDFFSSIWDRGTEGHGYGCHYRHWKEADPSYDYAWDAGGGWVNNTRSCPPNAGGGYTDIADLLPADPFGMELGSTLTAAIAGWIGGRLGVDQSGGDFFGAVNCSNGLLAGIGSCCNGPGGAAAAWSTIRKPEFSGKVEAAHSFPEKVHRNPVCQKPVTQNECSSSAAATCSRDANLGGGWDEEGWIRNFEPASQGSNSEGSAAQPVCSISSFDTRTGGIQPDKAKHAAECCVGGESKDGDISGCSSSEPCPESDADLGTQEAAGFPHDGLLLALGYLGVRDLLSVERVCKTLHTAVREDPYLWRCIHITPPLNDRLTDDALLSLTKRAAGHLQCLSLVECSKITDEGLKHVFEANPRLVKLSVPGCRLSVEVLINSLKMIKAPGMPGIKHLSINGLYGVTQAHYEDLKALLGMNQQQHSKPHKPQFYHSGLPGTTCDYDLPLDIELCPRCQNLRLVYDCPTISCQGKDSEPCRGCMICIPRCFNCGKCISDSEYEETFYLDYLCSDCVKLLVATEGPEKKGSGYSDLIPVLPLGEKSAGALNIPVGKI